MEFAFSIITGLVGGVALFLFGMDVLSSSLTQFAGGQFESMMERFTDKKIKGFLFATIITAIVQSSSATTVLTVGLVNSGILKLAQSASLIIGANLGTTATAWILSLNSMEGGSFILNLLKPASFTPYLALIGIAMQMFSKSEKKRNIGAILLGFSTMMIGMKLMSDAISPLKESAKFQETLTTFSNPLIGFTFAVLFTMIIQSSDAAVGILQALAMSVSISVGLAIPVVCGSQVGTCITSILSSLGTGKNGKRTALLQLYYNLIKNIPFMILFCIFKMTYFGSLLNKPIGAIGIAAFHTLINLIFSAIMLPLSGCLVALAVKTIPYSETEKRSQQEKLSMLEPIFLSNPPFAISQTAAAVRQIAATINYAFNCYINGNIELVQEKIERVKEYEKKTKNYINEISKHNLSEAETINLQAVQQVCLDYETINEKLDELIKTTKTIKDKELAFSDTTKRELDLFAEATADILSITLSGVKTINGNTAAAIKSFRVVISDLHSNITQRYIQRLHKNGGSQKASMYFTEICYSFEHIIDRCDNIAESIICLPWVKKPNTSPEQSERSFEVIKGLFMDKYSALMETEDTR